MSAVWLSDGADREAIGAAIVAKILGRAIF
jgi:hypothetical protein